MNLIDAITQAREIAGRVGTALTFSEPQPQHDAQSWVFLPNWRAAFRSQPE